MMRVQENNSKRKSGINKLLRILWELNSLKNLTTNEKALRDYDIYIRDIQRFLEKSSLATRTLDDIQVYIDDYQGVILHLKVI